MVRHGLFASAGDVLLALAFGLAGGGAFNAFGVPAGWMIGAMVATPFVRLTRRKPFLPAWLRDATVAVLGALVGTNVTPDLVHELDRWIASVAVLAASLGLAFILVTIFLRRVAAFDLRSAAFAAAPGGMVEMVLVGRAYGGDVRRILIVHSLRAPTTVLVFTGLVLILATTSATPAAAQQPDATGLVDVGGLAACAIAGFLIGRRLRRMAGVFLVPFLISGFGHGVGLFSLDSPSWLSAAAQVAIGTWMGGELAQFQRRELLRNAVAGLGSTVIMIAVVGLAAAIVSLVLPFPITATLLAYAPSGMTQLTAVAIALDLDPAFVAAHHTVRVIGLLVGAPGIAQICLKARQLIVLQRLKSRTPGGP